MRRRNLILGLLLVAAATGTETIVASTDCDRWIAQYRDQLAHSVPVHHLIQAKHRLAAYWRPKPRLLHTAHTGSSAHPLSPLEALNRFHVLCGDLPTDTDVALLPPVELTDMVPGVDPTPSGPGDSLIAMLAPPQEAGLPPADLRPTTPAGGIPTPLVGAPGAPIFGAPGGPIVPIAPPSPSPVPEPSPALLIATGLIAIPFIRRRR